MPVTRMDCLTRVIEGVGCTLARVSRGAGPGLFALGVVVASLVIPRPAQADWELAWPGGGLHPSPDAACQHFADTSGNGTIVYLRMGSDPDTFGCKIATGSVAQPFALIVTSCSAGEHDSAYHQDGCAATPVETKACGPGCGVRDGQVLRGNPVNVGTGNKHQRVVDFQTAGPHVLAFVRYYNSRTAARPEVFGLRSLGMGWSHNFDRALQFAPGQNYSNATQVTVLRPDGRQLDFQLIGGVWTPDGDVVGQLTKDVPNNRWLYVNERDETEAIGATGGLGYIQARDGYQMNMQWSNVAGTGWVITAVNDNQGRSLQFGYVNGRLVSMTAPDGQVYSYVYDSGFSGVPGNTRLVRVDSPGNGGVPEVETYVHEDSRYPFTLTGIIDANGDRFATYAYDTDLRATLSEHFGGADRTELVYHANGSRTVTGPLGDQTIYQFTDLLSLPRVTSEARQATANYPAATRTSTYDANAFLDTRTDWSGTVTDYDFDSRGLEVQRIEAVGTPQQRTITTTWHSTHRVPTQIVAPNVTIDMTYDTSGRLLTRTETDTTTHTVPYATNGRTRTWTYTYNAAGLVETVDGPRTGVTDITTYAYTAAGYLERVTNALSQVIEVTAHNGRGLPTSITDTNGVVTDMTYDPRGRLLTSTVRDPGSNSYEDAVTVFTYDAIGQITNIRRPDGSELSYEYDSARRVTAVFNALGERIEYTLDAMGNRTAETVKSDSGTIIRSQTAVFDEIGRLLQSLGAVSQTTAYAYDGDSNLETITDPLSRATGQAFDALHRLITVTDAVTPTAGITTYGYDAADNLVSVTDPRGLQTIYTVDGFGFRIRTDSPDTGITDYEYDLAGNMTRRTDARSVVTDYTYDALNRPTAQTYPAAPAENVAWTYDDPTAGIYGIGRLTGITDESGSTAITYDHRGNVAQETRTIGGIAYVTGYAYDLADKLASVTYPTGRVVTFGRDLDGRPLNVTTRTSALAPDYALAWAMAYRPLGPLESLTFANGLNVTLGYDLDGRLTDIDTGPAGVTPTVQDLTYVYDNADNILNISDALDVTRNQGFGYDQLDRLTSADGLYGTLGYNYDSVGNRTLRTIDDGLTVTSESYTPAAFSNQLDQVAIGGTPTRTMTHSASGQITADDRGGVAYGYGYDNSDRMTSVTIGGVATASYVHNALGQRVVKDAGGVVTHFHYDGAGRLIAETAPDGLGGFTLVKEYVDVDGLPLAVIEPGSGGGSATDSSIDNDATGTSSTGFWSAETTPSGYLGTDYRMRRGGDGTESYTWTPTIPSAARYQVYARWPELGADEGSTATYTVTHAAGATPVTVDQRVNGGDWNLLGAFDLAPGQNHRVDLDDLVMAPAAPPIDPNGGASGATTIINHNSPSVTRIGTWTVGSWYAYSAAGSGADRYQWPVPSTAGYYAVYANWVSAPNRASNSPYTIHHADGTTVRRVNQKIDNGVWKLLGIFQLDPGAGHMVELSDDASGYVIADQIRYIQQPSPPAGAIIVDNGDPEASAAGSWVTTSTHNDGGFWGGNWQHSAAGTGADTFTWTPTIATVGRYHIYARWSTHPNRATNSPYTVHHQYGSTEIRVNQEINGGRWNLLGTFEMTPGSSHRIELSDDADEYVIADAVMLVPDTTSRVVAADAIRLVANTAEDPLFVHADHLGTPRKMTDGTQAVVWDHVTRPFGETHQLLGLAENNRRFPGQYFDAETELNYNYFRDYDPALGRYVQSDPIGLEGGLNTYSYTALNPIVFFDRFGLDVRICHFPDAAMTMGHVGFGLSKEPVTSGFYPLDGGSQSLWQSVPGDVRQDVYDDDEPVECVVLESSAEQDRCMSNCRNKRNKVPGEYNLYTRQCTGFVRECLLQCGLPGGINTESPFPDDFFSGLPGAPPPENENGAVVP